LCEDIALDRDGAASDLKKWSIVLEVAKECVEGIEETSSDKSSMGKNLIRLHKRAASRFISFNVNNTSSAEDVKNLFTIWLLYAKVQAKFGQEDAARKTFRHIQHTKLGEKEADFYISLAQFESSLQEKDGLKNAIQVLKNGIDKGAGPEEHLISYLQRLTLELGAAVDTATGDSMERDLGGHGDDVLFQNYSTGDPVHARNQNLLGASSKVPKLKAKSSSILDKKRKNTAVDAIIKESESSASIRSASQSRTSERDNEISSTPSPPSATSSKERVPSLLTQKRELSNENSKPSDRIVSSSLSLLNKKRGLGGGARRGVIGGGAQRVSTVIVADQTMEEEEDEEDEPNSDISYLLNWNPSGPSNQAAKTAVLEQRAVKKLYGSENIAQKVLKPVSRFRPAMSMIQETTKENISSSISTMESSRSVSSNTTGSGQNSGSLHSHGSSNTSASKYDDTNGTEKSGRYLKSTHPGTSDHSNRSNQSLNHTKYNDTTGADDRETSCTSTSSSAHSQKINASSRSRSTRTKSVKNDPEAIQQKQSIKLDESFNNCIAATGASEQMSPSSMVHPDFQKIVCHRNIISVNNTPYIKLGVIGKGGSCKVYRTLSKDRSIVAIKKVKIAGMARKAIEGYANEIALLRRLRGNHAIIQLYDSEVDIKRKAIYLVMEPGEADLNHVVSGSNGVVLFYSKIITFSSSYHQCNEQLQQQGRKNSNGEHGSFVNMNFVRLTWQQMLSAVHCIHEERIIHGDLKPANFLFVKGILKLIDFGIAKAIQNDDTTNIHRESQVGTLNYMAPESILDSGQGANGASLMRCGRPSDIWSLGCILYQMCYSKTPFADLLMFPKLQAIVNPKHEIEFPATIDEAAIDAMKLCLRRKPEDRAPIVGENGLLNKHRFLN